jgi:hypothetical protein
MYFVVFFLITTIPNSAAPKYPARDGGVATAVTGRKRGGFPIKWLRRRFPRSGYG